MLDRVGEFQWAKLYGTRGQDQEGIDAYARLRTSEVASQRRYVVLQSRRVQRLSASDVDAAVADFLEGSWRDKTAKYIFATSYDLTDTSLDDALRSAADVLEAAGIEFEPWGAVEVSDALKLLPELVDDFFGRPWVELFCGPEGLERVQQRLERVDVSALREKLAAQYRGVFAAQNAVPRAVINPEGSRATGDGAASIFDDFVVVDVIPGLGPQSQTDELATTFLGDGTVIDAPSAGGRVGPGSEAAELGADGVGEGRSQTGLARPRRSFRAVEALLGDNRGTARDGALRHRADEWLTTGPRTLLVGAPGSGKSSLLRFVAIDLLSADPQSEVLQRVHGGRLPVWLPFGFLSRHLADNDGNSLESAVQAWLNARGMGDMWPLIKRAFADDRLLLLVDGIDEWKSVTAAHDALGAVESFLGQRPGVAAMMSSRPYGVDRLTFSATWSRADVVDLDDEQQAAMSAQYLAPPADASAPAIGPAPVPGNDEVWNRARVLPFLAELAAVPELAVLARKPLFLALLAKSWRGEPLPPKRFALYDDVVDLMIRQHPTMRRRFSTMVDLPLDEREFATLMEAVAFALVCDGSTYAVPVRQMEQLMRQTLCDDDVLGYPEPDARRMAKAALRMAEDEFGLLVPQGADHVGFVHRVLLDHLAGRRLARLEATEQQDVFRERLTDPAWLDVLLASLTAQTNPYAVAALLDHLSQPEEEQSWPLKEFQADSGTELIAHALAAEVELMPRKVTAILDRLVEVVETSADIDHQVNVATALVKACASPAVRRTLVPVFKRWLNATRPYPAPALYALRDLAVPDDAAASVLLHAMRAEPSDVRGNAAHAYARRFGAPRPSPTPEDVEEHDREKLRQVPDPQRLEPLVRLVREGPTVTAQAAAILAMATGWPDEEATQEHLDWARKQGRATLRITSMYMLMTNNRDLRTSSLLDRHEIDWVLGHVGEERWVSEHGWTEMTTELVLRLVSEAPEEYRTHLATFALETLKTNGSSGGDRSLCWRLACGPLSNDLHIRDWVRDQLNSSDEHALILYNVALVPGEWSEDPAFAQALAAYAAKRIDGIPSSAHAIAQNLPLEQSKAVLLQGLTGFRPQSVAWRLVAEFPDDNEVNQALRDRLTDDTNAAQIPSVAVRVLGTYDGFIRILDLLKAAIVPDSEVDGERQVLLASAVATAWRHMRDAVAADDAGNVPEEELTGISGSTPEERLAEARRALAEHPEEDVCAACTAVDTYLGWQVADVIYTWPRLTVEYALKELQNNRHVTEGLSDNIHSAALRNHVEKPAPDSPRVVDLALDLMLFLAPELREVLAHELCRSNLPGKDLLDIFESWKNDPDDGVRQTIAVGVTLVLLREQASRTEMTPEMDNWRMSVRKDLLAYGPHMDANRCDAWLSMLLLNDLSLIDGLVERIGDPDEPGVELSDIYDGTDVLLVSLVADRWDELQEHFGHSLLNRLSGSRLKPAEQKRKITRAVKALATAANRNPAIADLVESHLTTDTGTDAQDLGLSIPVIQMRKRQRGADQTALTLVIGAAEKDQNQLGRSDTVTKWALKELLDPDGWNVPSEDIRTVLTPGGTGHAAGDRTTDASREATVADRSALPRSYEPWESPDAWRHSEFSFRRTAWSLLFPTDALTQAWVSGLGSWFTADAEPEGSPATWLETAALTFGASPARHLPSLVE